MVLYASESSDETPIVRTPRANAIAFTAETPIRSPVNEPGPTTAA
jgi:hypothetical protein